MAEKNTLARPYAEAIFELATATGDFDAWTEKLQFLSQIISLDEVKSLIKDPDIKREDIIAIIKSVGKEQLDEQAINLIRLAGENRRLAILPQISEEYEKMKAQALGTIEAQVISAYAVNATQKKLIVEKLKKRFNKEISITTRIDKSLVAGIVIRVGDLVIDGSVSNQLQKITHALMR